jgi:hypothetical protein
MFMQVYTVGVFYFLCIYLGDQWVFLPYDTCIYNVLMGNRGLIAARSVSIVQVPVRL